MTTTDKFEMPSAAETRKRRLWMDTIQWLKIEINSRFGVHFERREEMHHLEDMAATIGNSGEFYDKEIQKQLSQIEESVRKFDSAALRTPIYVKTPPGMAMDPQELTALYDELAGINDEIERTDDGRALFGSLNDADQFNEIVQRLGARTRFR